MKFLTRLLIYSSFIFYSCNETSEIGIDELLVNQKEKIKVHYTEIPLEVSNVYFDSVRTDDGDLYFGRNNDPVFGDIEAIGYSQFIYTEGLDILIPGESSENYYLPNQSSQLDSAVLYLKFSKAYGGSDFDEQEVTISQIEDTLFSSALYTSNRYTEISPPKGVLGFTRFNIVNSKDTFLTVPIKDNYGRFILNRIIDGTPEVELLDQLRGLAILPGEENNRMIGFDLDHEDSKFVLYFNNPESGNANSPAEDSLQFIFRMNSPLTKHYSYYNIDRSSSELADVDNLNKNEKFNFQDKIYWQSASGSWRNMG